MGWTYPSQCTKREDLVKYLRRTLTGVKVLRSSAVNNEFWALVQAPDGRTLVWRWLLQGGTREYPGWGYKDVPHREGLDCPVSYLLLLEDSVEAEEMEWRDAVREQHRKVSSFKKQKKTLTPGTEVKFRDKTYKLVESLGTKGWKVQCLDDNQYYRMPVKHLNTALREQAET